MSKQVDYYYYTHEIVRETLLAACIDPHLTSSAKAVLACLFVHAYTRRPSDIHADGYLVDENGKRIGCFPSQATIASEAQISETAVSLALKLLRKHGYVRVKKVGNSNDYLIDLTKGKSPKQIRAEGKARRQLSTEKPKKEGRKHSDETRAKMSASHKTRRRPKVGSASSANSTGLTSVYPTNSTGLTSVYPTGLTRVYANVEKLNEEKKFNVDASAPSSSTLDPSNDYFSPDNEVDLSPDTSIDVRSSPDNEVDLSRDKSIDVSSSPKDPSSTRRHFAWWEIPDEIRELSDHDLGVRSSPDGSPDAYRAERREKMQQKMERLDADNYAAAVSPALSTMCAMNIE